jgi:hypothetical protein
MDECDKEQETGRLSKMSAGPHSQAKDNAVDVVRHFSFSKVGAIQAFGV